MKRKITLVDIFILNHGVMTLILLLAFGVYGTDLYLSEQQSVRQRMEPALDKEVDLLNYDLFNLETNVQKLKSMVELFEVMPPALRVEKFRSFAATAISPYATQYNAYFALAPSLARKYFAKDAFVYMVFRDPSLQGTKKYHDPNSFLAQVFFEATYYQVRDPEMQWWWMNEGSEEVNFSEFYFDENYVKKVMFSTTRGLYRDGKLEAVVGIDTLTSDIASRLGDFKIGETGGLIVVDGNGHPIIPLISRDLPLIGSKYFKANTNEEFKRTVAVAATPFSVHAQGIQEFSGADGKIYLTYSRAVKGRPWYLVIYQEKSEAYSGLYVRLVSLLVSILATYVVLTLMVFLTGRYVLKRDRFALDQLQKSKENAEAATRSKSLFLSTMSHEIRTPLNAILGSSELLEETPMNEDQRALLRSLKSAGDSLLGIIDNVLDFSKFDSGRMQLEQRQFLLSELIREVEALVVTAIIRKGLKYFYIGPEHDRWMIGDSLRLKQVLMNLLGNAVKFTEKGSVELRVQVEPSEDSSCENFYFEVKDTGVGIAKENLAKVFDEFGQEDSSVTRRFGGTGLGLSIAKKIVGMMGGELSCESQQSLGSRFFFTVRLKSRIAESKQVESAAAREVGDKPLVGTPAMEKEFRVLVVDDMEENHMLLKAYLKKLPWVMVDSAYTGMECLEKWKQNSYDLIFMDVQMPQISGLDTVRNLRTLEKELHRKHTPIVIISANSFAEDVAKSLSAGADEHRGKPIRREAILELVKKYADKKDS